MWFGKKIYSVDFKADCDRYTVEAEDVKIICKVDPSGEDLANAIQEDLEYDGFKVDSVKIIRVGKGKI